MLDGTSCAAVGAQKNNISKKKKGNVHSDELLSQVIQKYF
jgi:hypothetical protein